MVLLEGIPSTSSPKRKLLVLVVLIKVAYVEADAHCFVIGKVMANVVNMGGVQLGIIN